MVIRGLRGKVADPLRVDPLRVNFPKINIYRAGHRDISSLCIRKVTVRYKKYSGPVRECF